MEVVRGVVGGPLHEAEGLQGQDGLQLFFAIQIFEAPDGGGAGRAGSLVPEDFLREGLLVVELIGIVHDAGLLAFITDPPPVATGRSGAGRLGA